MLVKSFNDGSKISLPVELCDVTSASNGNDGHVSNVEKDIPGSKMQGVEDVPGDLEARQTVYNAAKLFMIPHGSGSAQDIDNLSTSQFRQIRRITSVVGSLLQLPQHISHQFGHTQVNFEADVLCHSL